MTSETVKPHILIVTDAWHPQVNGVVQTLSMTRQILLERGHRITMLTPEGMPTRAMPGYPEIRLAMPRPGTIRRQIAGIAPDMIHIATEGPLGLRARRYCLKRGLPFTTSYHTRFPEYLAARVTHPALSAVARRAGYRFMKWFHAPCQAMMVGTPSMIAALRKEGFANLRLWTRGVDHRLFHPDRRRVVQERRPVALYAGRVAIEKGLDDFLSLPFEGTKVIVGDGPDLPRLRRKYPDAVFTGYRRGEALAEAMAGADVFVFPSRTDTFGLVMLEAMACGVPVAAYRVPGPLDVVEDGISGALDDDLGKAVTRALACSRQAARLRAMQFSWAGTAASFAAIIEDAQAQKVKACRYDRPSPINHRPTTLGADDAGG